MPRPPSSPASGDGAPVELRGGALWWQHLHASGMQPVYGAEWSFVMQRPAVGGPGLVRVARPPKPVRSAAPAPPSPPVVWAAPGAAAGTGLALAGSHLGSCSVVIDTEYAVLRDAPPVPPNTTCTGIVWQRSGEAAELPPRRRRASSKHPRRTQWVSGTLVGVRGWGC